MNAAWFRAEVSGAAGVVTQIPAAHLNSLVELGARVQAPARGGCAQHLWPRFGASTLPSGWTSLVFA